MKSWKARALALTLVQWLGFNSQCRSSASVLAGNWGSASRHRGPRPPEIRTAGHMLLTQRGLSVRLKGETSEQASKTAFSRDYLINPFLHNRNIDFHRFPEYFREYLYWQENLRSREELNKEKGLNFLSDFPFTTFSTFLEWNFWFLTLKIKYHCLALLKPVFQFSLVTQSCLTLCDPMDRSMPGLPVHHQLPDLAQEW